MQTLKEIKGIGPKTEEKLNALGIHTPTDLVGFLPSNYVDLDSVSDLTLAENGAFVLLILKIVTVAKPFRKGRLEMFRATGQAEDGKKVKLVWYNANYVAKNVVLERVVRCYGKLKAEKGYELINPAYEIYDGETGGFSGIKPIYFTRGAVPQASLAGFIRAALPSFRAASVIDASFGLADLTEAYRKAHTPTNMEEISRAKERIFIEETVKRICAYRLIRESARRTAFYSAKKSAVEPLIQSLPYALTPSQTEAVERILSALVSDKPLNAMLTGDVGSGKTVVALTAAYFAVRAGRQAALIAPTEILALQHARTFEKLLQGHGIRLVCLLGSDTAAQKKEKRAHILSGAASIVVGTHAVLSKGVLFKDLAFAVIDEQHRFGVAQRTALIEKGAQVDTLTLSATPIPRSLRLTMFGDVDVIHIERRHDNDNIQTAVVGRDKRKNMLDYIVEQCKKGKQAYLVAPKIYDDEGIETNAAEAVYKEFLKVYGGETSAALLHGKLSANEKSRILTAFSQNEISVLISTTVIEVGIDVPNAALMIVFGAERFGLASLHQLRGRIGRDGNRAFCFLYTEKEKEEEILRLRTMTAERDGLKIAEEDYAMRGAGDWMGESQSGKTGFRPSIALMKQARKIADEIDLNTHLEVFQDYGERLRLNRISLN